jgi:hypothetical protein
VFIIEIKEKRIESTMDIGFQSMVKKLLFAKTAIPSPNCSKNRMDIQF